MTTTARPAVRSPKQSTTQRTLTPARSGRLSAPRRFATLVATEARVWLRDISTVATTLPFPIAFLLGIPAINEDMRHTFTEGVFAGFTGVDVFVPAVLAMSMTAPAVMALPTAFAGFRDKGVLRRMSATPLRPQAMLGAHVLINVAVTVLAAALALVAGHLVFGLTMPNDLAVVVGSYAAGVVVMFALGTVLAAVVKNPSHAAGVGMLVFFASLVSAGVMTPGGLPDGLAQVARFIPLGAAAQAMQEGWFGDGVPVLQLAVMAVWTAVLVPTAAKLFRWS